MRQRRGATLHLLDAVSVIAFIVLIDYIENKSMRFTKVSWADEI